MYSVNESGSRKMQSRSYTHGPGNDKVIYRTLPSLLNQRAKEMPNRAAKIFRYPTSSKCNQATDAGRIVVTFGQLRERSLNLAAHLLGMGVNTGDKVAVIGSNCVEWIYLEYACLSIGALLIKVPAHFCTGEEISAILKRTNSTFLVVDPQPLKVLRAAFPHILDKIQGCKDIGTFNFHNKAMLLTNTKIDDIDLNSVNILALSASNAELYGRVQQIESAMNPDDYAIIFQTSGSTGIPKSVLYTHFGMVNTTYATWVDVFGLHSDTSKAIIFNDRPFAWIGSQCYLPVVFGISMIRLDPELTLSGNAVNFLVDVLDQENVTAGMLMPYLLFDMMKGATEETVSIPSKLRTVATGGEMISDDIVEFARTAFKALHVIYGSTECLPIAMRKAHSIDQATKEKPYRTISISEMKLVDECENIVPYGKIGNIQCRNPYSMLGYMKDDLTVEGKPSTGWIDMGDLGVMSEDGSFNILGRSKDMISRGTVKIYPAALEKVLHSHVKVDKAIVVGVPDPRLYQEVCACIKPKADVILPESELRDFFISSTQAGALGFTPKYYMILEELPLGSSGKYDRNILAQKAIKLFNLK